MIHSFGSKPKIQMPQASPRRPRWESSPVSGGRRAKVPSNSPIAKRRPAGANEAGASPAARLRRRRGRHGADFRPVARAVRPTFARRGRSREGGGRYRLFQARRDDPRPATQRPKASSSSSRDASRKERAPRSSRSGGQASVSTAGRWSRAEGRTPIWRAKRRCATSCLATSRFASSIRIRASPPSSISTFPASST